MLPDLRVVTIAVISTFLFAVSVGFYTSSRLISERKPRPEFARRDRRAPAQPYRAELAGAGAAAVEPARSRFRGYGKGAAQSGSRGARRAVSTRRSRKSQLRRSAETIQNSRARTACHRSPRRSKRPKSKRPRSKPRRSKHRRSRPPKVEHRSSNCQGRSTPGSAGKIQSERSTAAALQAPVDKSRRGAAAEVAIEAASQTGAIRRRV